MRSTSRIAGLMALAAVAITCTDAPTAPGAHRPGYSAARLAMAPSFSPTATRAYSALASMGIAVTQVRIRLRTASGSLARDTTIQFGSDDTLHIQLPVEIQGTEQSFSALIELLDANGTVLFAQTQDVIARAAGLPSAPSPVITLEYVGPGATALSIAVTPTDVTVPSGAEPVLTAVGTDASGNPVTSLLVGWSSSDATLASVTTAGSVATVHGTGRRGTVTITATTPTGVSGSARLSLLPLPGRLVVVSGDAQTSVAGQLLAQPLVVELRGVDGGPIPQATVSFRAVTTGAAVGTITATTDAVGRASTSLTLGRTGGAYSFEATSAGVAPAAVSATATPAPATVLALVSGNTQTDSTGAGLAPFIVRASDEFGAPVAGAAITWTRIAGLGTLGAAPDTTDAQGLARSSYVLGALPGADTVRATIAGASGTTASVLFTSSTISRGASALSIASGGGQTGLPGTTLPTPLVAVVSDALGHRLAGVSVQWQSSVAGLATFASPTSVTDANGEARTVITLGTTAGTTTVTASVGTLTASTTLGVSVGPAATLVPIAGTGAGVVGGTVLLRARVTDAAGNPVAGHTVSWAVTAGGGTLPITSSTTNALGDAEVTWTLGFVVGAQTVTATSSGLTGSPLVFTIDAAAATGSLLRLATQPGAPSFNAPSGVVLATQPVVQLTDAAGANPVYQAGVVVTVAPSDAQATLRGTTTAVTDSAGVATFSGLNVVGTSGRSTALVFTANGYTSVTSNPLAIGAGVPATMAALPASTTGVIGLPVDIAPAVIVRDSSGNPVSGVVVTFTAAGGTITTASATTDASGKASAGGWVLGTVGDNVVTATSGTLAGSPVTFHATGSAGAVAAMKFVSSPVNALTNAPLSTVLVALVDASGNVVTTATDAITLAVGGGRNVTLQGTTTQAAINGIATFADLAIATPGTGYQLEATSGQLAPVPSAAFDVDAPVQVGSVRLVSGTKQLLPIKASLPPDSVAFVVHDVNEAPMGGVTVSFRLNEFPTCSIAAGTATTDAKGVVMRAVTAGDAIGACEVTATAGDARATAKIAVYPSTATHVWFGGTIEVDHNYDVATNWLDVRDGKESQPMPSDVAYVPYWETNLGPQLQGDAQLAALGVQRYATVDLNGYTLTTTGSIAAATASVANGRVVAGGGSGTRVAGQFDRLDVGRIDYCGSDAAALDTLSTKELRVICRATVGTYATTDTLDASGSGELSISANATLVTNRGAAITGGKVTTAGTLYVGSDAVITPSSLDVTSGGQLHVAGRATLGRVGTNVSFATGSILQIDGDATFDGGGTVAADAVMLSGNTSFTGAGPWSFPNGELFVYGNLDVKSGQGVVLSTTGSHLAHFAGSKAQRISVAPGAASFAQASVENRQDIVSFAGPVSFTSDKLSLDLATGAKVEMSNGPVDVMSSVQVGNAASLTLFTDMSLRSGELRLLDGATFTVQEGVKFTGACTTTVNAILSKDVTIGGFGTINGLPASLSACTK